MCQLKSGIIFRDRTFVPDYDHHTQMLEEKGIVDDYIGMTKTFVKYELLPKDNDVFSDIKSWLFKVDQDEVPEWFDNDRDRYKNMAIEAVQEWAKEHIHIDIQDIELKNGTHYLKNCEGVTCDNSTVEAYDNSTVEACDNSTVKACDNSTVKAYDNSTVEACGNSTVEAYGSSTVEAYDNSTVRAYGNSTVEAHDNSTVEAYDNNTVEACGNSTVEAYGNSTIIIPDWSSNKRENIILSQNSTLKDCNAKTIYQSGDWQLVLVSEKQS